MAVSKKTATKTVTKKAVVQKPVVSQKVEVSEPVESSETFGDSLKVVKGVGAFLVAMVLPILINSWTNNSFERNPALAFAITIPLWCLATLITLRVKPLHYVWPVALACIEAGFLSVWA